MAILESCWASCRLPVPVSISKKLATRCQSLPCPTSLQTFWHLQILFIVALRGWYFCPSFLAKNCAERLPWYDLYSHCRSWANFAHPGFHLQPMILAKVLARLTVPQLSMSCYSHHPIWILIHLALRISWRQLNKIIAYFWDLLLTLTILPDATSKTCHQVQL